MSRKSSPKPGEAIAAAALRVAAAVAPRYVDRRVAHAFLTPRRASGRPAALQPPDHAVRVRVDEMWIAAWKWGRGPAVMLVHGWEDDHRCFAPVIAALRARGQAVVAFDLPAHGHSDGQIAILPTIARAISTVGAVLGPITALAGHSFGGAAVTYALATGASAERVAIVAAPVSLAGALDLTVKRLGLSAERRAGIAAELHRRTGVTIESLDLEPLAAGLAVPALVIHSRDDRMVSLRAGERLARAWPGAELVVAEGLGHRRILTDPGVLERLTGFLAPETAPLRASA
jgi:pimeloyl-ACP methyl ester carboxylesterase